MTGQIQTRLELKLGFYFWYLGIWAKNRITGDTQWLTVIDCQLGNDTDRGKHSTVVYDVMMKSMHQHIPLFKPFVACLLPILY